MKIIHVITRLICGGADENTVISCNAQVREGHEIWLIYGAGSNPKMLAELTPQVRRLHLPSLQRDIAPASDARALVELWRLARAIRPDVMHTHTSKAGTLGRIAGWLAGAPVLIHGVHILPFQNVGRTSRLLYVTIERALAGVTDAFIDVSEGMRDGNLAAHVGQPWQHHVVYSGMDCDRFRYAKPFAREALCDLLDDAAFAGRGKTPKIVLYAAAFEARKRHLDLLKAFAKVVEAAPSAKLLLLGEGPGMSAAESRAATLGLSGHVHLLGHRSDIERWIATADLCVFCSEREGLPRVAVQYVMAGKPVVATALPGLERVIRPGVSGYLVPLEHVGQMAEPMITLLKDDARRRRFANAARDVDLSDWSSDRMTRAIEAIYSSASRARAREQPCSARGSILPGVASAEHEIGGLD